MKPLFVLFTVLILTQSSYYDWTPVDKIIQNVINVGGFPGATLRIANKTHTIYSNNYGTFTRSTDPFGSLPMSNDTIFDIASLSKVTGALCCIMTLVDTNKISVNDPVIKYVPEYNNNGKENTTIKNLLLHNAGLIPDYPGNNPNNKTQVMEWLYKCKLDYPIATKFVYSDLSFILLGEIAERVSGQKLEDFAKANMNRM